MSISFTRVRKATNFRFSETELANLDALVTHYEQNRHFFFSWGRVTRTDVLRKLIKAAFIQIEDSAHKKLQLDAEADAKAVFAKHRKKKLVKK